VAYQPAQRWIRAGCFEAIAHDLRAMICQAEGRSDEPSAVILDGRTLRSTAESGERAEYDGNKKTKGSKVHIAVDTLGNLMALVATPANEQERAQVAELAHQVQEATGDNVEIAFVDQGCTGDEPRRAAEETGIHLHVMRLSEAKKGFVLLPRRWVVERSIAWFARFRRLARDYERLPQTVALSGNGKSRVCSL
jgi:transposase